MEHWLENVEVVLHTTEMSPIYIPSVREEWIQVVRQKPPSIPEDPENPSEQPKKQTDPKPASKHIAKKSGTGCQRARKKDEDKGNEPQQNLNVPLQPGDTLEEPTEDPLPPGPDPKNSQPLSTDPKNLSRLKQKPKSTAGATPKGVKPKSTAGMTSEGQDIWYKTDVAYDLKKTGSAAVPPEDLLEVTRKRKVGGQPKPSTSGGPPDSKRKITMPARWLPYTQARTTYMMGDKITPAWGLIHKGSMDTAENWRIPLYKPPKMTEKQEAVQKEAKKKKLRYRPGQLALKEIKYYKFNAGFIVIVSISAIRKLCLEIGYDCKQNISFQLHAYRLLQEAAEWYLVRVFQETNLLAAHAKRITITPKDMVLARKVSGDYGLHNTWAWNSDNLVRPWAYTGKLTKEQRKIRKHYFGSKQGYKKQI